jgi:hypothetical protein
LVFCRKNTIIFQPQKKGPQSRALFSIREEAASAIHILLITVLLAALVRFLLPLLSALLPALLALLLPRLLAGTLLILALLLLLTTLLARLVVLVHAFLRGWGWYPAHCENRFRFPLVPEDPRVPRVS